MNDTFGNVAAVVRRDPGNTQAEVALKRRPGRPVSLASRQAVLDVAADLLDERGYHGFTVDEVARRSGVSKATIYKHWPGGYEVAVEAYGDRVTRAVPVHSSGDAIKDLSGQVVRLARFYASPRGRVVAQLLAAGVDNGERAALVRERFFAARRDETLALIKAGQDAGQLDPAIDINLANDLLFGAIVFRLFNGLPPVTARQATAIATMAMRGIAQP